MLPIRSLKLGIILLTCGGLVGIAWNSAHSQVPGSGGGFFPSSGGPPSAPGGMPMGMASGMMTPNYSQAQIAEIQLGQQARGILQQYAVETDAGRKTEFKKTLRGTLISQFELQHQRRDEELKKIEKRLADLRTKLTKRFEAKNTIINRRLEQLISDADGLGWGADDVPQDLFGLEGGYSPYPGSSGPGPAMMGAPSPLRTSPALPNTPVAAPGVPSAPGSLLEPIVPIPAPSGVNPPGKSVPKAPLTPEPTKVEAVPELPTPPTNESEPEV